MGPDGPRIESCGVFLACNPAIGRLLHSFWLYSASNSFLIRSPSSMGRRGGKGKAAAAAAAAAGEEPKQHQYVQPVDPPRAVMAVHPQGAAIAVAVGPELRVYDARCAPGSSDQ
jgi:hypothetical protein